MTAAAPSPTAANGLVATQRPSPASGNAGEGRGPGSPVDPADVFALVEEFERWWQEVTDD